MLKIIKNLYLHATKKLFETVSAPARSSHWPVIEHAFLKANPTCAACGSTVKLQVHHKHPFHLHPEMELDPKNLITLCMEPGKEDHLYIGHGDSWKGYNPNVEADAAELANNASRRDEIVARAKKNRLME